MRAYLSGQEAAVLRSPAAVEQVLELSGGVFLFAIHFARALAAGAYSAVDELPEARRFYADYLARLRDRVGPELFGTAYEQALLLLAAARVPVTRSQLHRWGVPADRLEFALRDVGEFVRELRHRDWHDGVGDSTEPRYEIAHEAFVRYLASDAAMSAKLKAAHRTIANVALRHTATRWENLDPADDADLYDVGFVLSHVEEAGLSGAAKYLRGDEVLALAVWRIADRLDDLARYELAVELFERCEELVRDLVENRDRPDPAYELGNAIHSKGNALRQLCRLEEAVESYDEAIVIRRTLMENRGQPEFANDLARALMHKGVALRELGRLAEALECSDEALAILRDLVQTRGRADLADDLAGTLNIKGNGFQRLGRLVEAAGLYDETIAIRRHLLERPQYEILNELLRTCVNR